MQIQKVKKLSYSFILTDKIATSRTIGVIFPTIFLHLKTSTFSPSASPQNEINTNFFKYTNRGTILNV